jgi:hypothetical protein
VLSVQPVSQYIVKQSSVELLKNKNEFENITKEYNECFKKCLIAFKDDVNNKRFVEYKINMQKKEYVIRGC